MTREREQGQATGRAHEDHATARSGGRGASSQLPGLTPVDFILKNTNKNKLIDFQNSFNHGNQRRGRPAGVRLGRQSLKDSPEVPYSEIIGPALIPSSKVKPKMHIGFFFF